MGLFQRINRVVRETVRYKLLVLVLFPILLVMPIVLALAIYWGASFTYDQLFRKVRTDLRVADDVFGRLRQDYLSNLGRLAESYTFRTALTRKDKAEIQQQLSTLKFNANFTYLHITDVAGNRLFESDTGRDRSSATLLQAAQGKPVVNVEIFSQADLANEDPFLPRKIELPLLKTPYARPSARRKEDRGMMIRAIYPIKNQVGDVLALLDGGVLLNNNFSFVDAIRNLVYGSGSLLKGSLGTVTVFLDDVRITTNVPLAPGERALGTRVSDQVRTRVLDQGKIWIDRAFVVNDWYISAYEPILDENGQRVGMLYSGYLEAPYRNALLQALVVLVLLFIVLMILSSLVAIRGAKSIFKPLEAMTAVVHATRSGEARRIGKVASQDEIGVLAREFDVMLDLLQERNEQLQAWADQLETKVAERTAELQHKNADLQRTISVLRQTRQQLVVAEKLAALGELAAGVAHEINNPTQVILGNLDMIVAELGTLLTPYRHELDLIVQQVYRIQEIIRNLLQYARPDEYAGYISDVDVNYLVKDTLKLVQHLRKTNSFTIDLALNAGMTVQINQQELQQVLVNLLVNAIHALPDKNGRIQIVTRNWEDRGVAIDVIDNGSGMEEELLGHIFNPFYSTKGQGEGTGLGLSVSYGLIRRYGGNITVKSNLQVGTQFSVWLLREPVLVEDEETIVEQLRAIEEDAG
ncbi:MAG: HAMP domain-containing protein [Gammaproteobacteria bacterium]|nr:HAMP domain-containing protein [Gammaproteobacteria bacterium]